MHENIHKKFILGEIALSMGTNRCKLAASFKQVLGLGVFEWIRHQRMSKAQFLLLSSQMTILQIAFEVGYENSTHFSTSFKKQFNLTPRQQRKLNTQLNICHTHSKDRIDKRQ